MGRKKLTGRTARFTQSAVTRALRGAIAAGTKVRRVEILSDGIVLILDDEAPIVGGNALDGWRASRDDQG